MSETMHEKYVPLMDTQDTILLGDLAMSGAGRCPDLKACMRDACIGACTDTLPDPEPEVA